MAIAIDVESLLREGMPLCKLVDGHKFITDRLPPEFLLSTEPIDAANLSGAQGAGPEGDFGGAQGQNGSDGNGNYSSDFEDKN